MSRRTNANQVPSSVAPITSLRCLRCAGQMRAYVRSGVAIEQCQDCRGIFLDGGELERLIDAEGGGWSGRVGPPWLDPQWPKDGEPIARSLAEGR